MPRKTNTFALSLSVSFVSLFVALAGASPAAARGNEQDRVAIESFRGPQAQRLQGAIESGLMNKYYVVPDFSIEDMAKRRGVALRDPDGMAEVGRALQVRAFLSANVQKRGTWKVSMVVRRGDTGEALGRFVIANRRLDQLESTLEKRTSRQIGALIQRVSFTQGESTRVRTLASNDLAPPSVDAGEKLAERAAAKEATKSAEQDAVVEVVEGDAGEPSDADEADGKRALPVATLGLETRVFNRSFKHTENQSRLSDYNLSGAFSAAMSAELHPFASSKSVMSALGLFGSLEYGIGVGSRQAGSEERISTDVHAYEVGLSYSVMSGGFTFTPAVAYGSANFDAGDKSGAPNARYQTVQPGASFAWALSEKVSLRAAAAYVHVLDAGPLKDAERFPRATVTGGAGSLGLAYAVLDSLELSASGGVRRYGIATNVIPGDKVIAGGAVDQTTWLGLGLSFRPRIGSR